MAEASFQSQRPPPLDGPYILRKLVANLPLSADGPSTDVRITCVEVWSMRAPVYTCASPDTDAFRRQSLRWDIRLRDHPLRPPTTRDRRPFRRTHCHHRLPAGAAAQ
jgi:hypothetical protein